MTRPAFKIADLFCGAGGSSTGAQRAIRRLGGSMDLLAINHWNIAVNTHQKNHPNARHIVEDVTKADPVELVGHQGLHLLMASPECFPADTMILTARGLVPIQHVGVGDYVLTHKNRWRIVLGARKQTASTVRVKGHGHPGLESTANHPYYAIRRRALHKVDARGHNWRYPEPDWTAAADMTGKHFWATPDRCDPLDVPSVGGRGMDQTRDEFWWLVGRWLGDGSVRLRKQGETSSHELTICCGKHESDDLAKRLAVFEPRPGKPRSERGELRWRRRDVRTATLFETAHSGLCEWLVQHFGKLAHGKTVPAWALSMPAYQRRALLEGYVSADGHHTSGKAVIRTVSKRLAIGIRLLAASLGLQPMMHCRNGQPEHSYIEGRTVTTRPIYTVAWTLEHRRNDAFNRNGHLWAKVKHQLSGRSGVEVYNLQVAEDESYVADGIVVHNCRFYSTALGGRPVRDQGRMNPWVVVKWITAVPVDSILVENVPEFVKWGPVCTLADGHSGKHRDIAPSDVADDEQCARVLPDTKGIYFQAWVKAIWEAGYSFEWKILNAADYGDATTRRRFFGIGRRNRGLIRWPEPTHRNPDESPNGMFDSRPVWRAAREIIDWEDLGSSMLERKTPLSMNTRRRVAAGLSRYGGMFADQLIGLLDLPDDIVESLQRGNGRGKKRTFVFANRANSAPRDPDSQPIHGLTTTTGGGQIIVTPEVQPFFFGQHSNAEPRGDNEPLPTVTAVARVRHFTPIAEPLLLGQHGGNVARPPDAPLPTITADGALSAAQPVAQIIVPYYGTGVADTPDDPLATITTKARHGLGQAVIVPYRGDDRNGHARVPHSVDAPLTTMTAGGKNHALAQAVIVPYGPHAEARTAEEPLPVIMTKDRLGAAFPDAYFVDHFGERPGSETRKPQDPRARSVDKPASAVTSRGAGTLVQPIVVQTDQTGAAWPRIRNTDEPIGTIVSKQNQGLATPVAAPVYSVDGDSAIVAPMLVPAESIEGIDPRRLAVVDGRLYILDIRYRMLKNRELARAMSFDDSEYEYEFTGTQTDITRQIGNAVPCRLAEALVGAIISRIIDDRLEQEAQVA